jgi:hypothetical protein
MEGRYWTVEYEYLWTALEAIVVELKKKRVTVLPELVDDLKSAQTLIKIHRTDPTALDVATEIERYLETVEANLIYLARSDVGEAYADDCVRRLHEARLKGLRETVNVPSTFVTGVPKGAHWIRLKVSDLLDDNEVLALVDKWALSRSVQADGFLLIYGAEEKVKAFIKEISDKIRGKDSSASKSE